MPTWVRWALGVTAIALLASIVFQPDTTVELEEELREVSSAKEQLSEQNAQLRELASEQERRLSEREADIGRLMTTIEELRAAPALGAPAHPSSGVAGPIEQLLASEGPERAMAELAAAFERGELTPLEILNLVVARPELLVSGLNDRDLPAELRSILVDGLHSVPDPLALLERIEVESEPSQRISGRLGALVSSRIDGEEELDARGYPIIARLLAGNDMHGGKVNLYPTLAQLAGRGDEDARAEIDRLLESGTFFESALRIILDPPRADESGRPLEAAVIYSIQFNKGKWPRPRQFRMGDVVLSIGDVTVRGPADFQRAVRRYESGDGSEMVEARVYERAGATSEYRVVTRQLDPGDFRLMYGVRTIRSLD